MFDPGPRREPSTPAQWWFTGIALVLVLGLFAADIIHDFHPVKLSAFLVVLFRVPLLLLHEAGHAVVAYVLGWKVIQIVIGMGKQIGSFRLGHAKIELRVFPVEGFVRCIPTNLHLPGLKNAIIYLAGPGADLLVAFGTLALIGPDRLFQPSEHYWDILWQSLALAAASQGIMNLIPFAMSTPEGDIVSDGLGIILSMLRPSSTYVLKDESPSSEQADEQP
jgi:hypothetical protein